MAVKTLDDLLSEGVEGRGVLVRSDLNVPLDGSTITDDGRIKVADFGLARAVSAETQHTNTNGVLIGTVSYLAPELVVEQRADARADVHRIIFDELCQGEVRNVSRETYQRIIQQLAADGAQAVILGCTEICLLLGPNDACLPLYDTAALHVDAGLNWALQS